jgi:hypothetical protein
MVSVSLAEAVSCWVALCSLLGRRPTSKGRFARVRVKVSSVDGILPLLA